MLRHHAFSLVELLVSLGVIGLLLAISTPVLLSARREARTTDCLATMRSIGQIYFAYAADKKDLWPNISPPIDQGYLTPPQWGNQFHTISPIDQIEFWGYDLRGYAGDGDVNAFAQTFCCPLVYPAMLESHAHLPQIVPAGYAARSYLYSPALFTPSSSWLDRRITPDVNHVVADVRHSDLVFPSSKSVLTERTSRHGRSNVSLINATSENINILAADGHVERRSPQTAIEPHQFSGRSLDNWIFFPWTDAPVPFLGTHRGAAGRDW